MGENERQDVEQTEFDVLLQGIRDKSGNIDAKKALELLLDRLANSTGYYRWIPLGEEDLTTWQIKIPRDDLENQAWLKEEKSEIVHVCRPIKFLECVEKRDKNESSKYVGYVRDKNNKYMDEAEFHCTKCKRQMPLEWAKKGKIHLFLHGLQQKV